MRMTYLTLLTALVVGLAPLTSFAQYEDPDDLRATRFGWYVTYSAFQAFEAFEHNADLDDFYQPKNAKFEKHDDYSKSETATQFSNRHRTTSHFSDSIGGGAAVGLHYDRWLASELRFEKHNGFRAQGLKISPFDGDRGGGEGQERKDYHDTHTNLDLDDHQLDVWTLTSMAKAFYPFANDRFQPFAMGGLGVINGSFSGPNARSGSETELLWRYGLGFDYYLTENVVLGMEAARNEPTGDLREFDFWTIGTHLTYRFP